MSDFLSFMSKREHSRMEGHDRAITAEVNKKHLVQCQIIAKEQAKADPSDPFVYNRVMSQLTQGITLRGDYEVNFHQEQTWAPMDPKYKISVQRPRNWKVPCK